jgi:hypothetical protein
MKPLSVLILSDKSSGSSVLQRELARHSAIKTMRRPPHQEGETLFWSKAAALFDLPQPPMIDSTLLPMSRHRAHGDIASLLADNLTQSVGVPETREQLFDVWRLLTLEYAPVFLEKSPHHLHNRAVLELVLETSARLRDVEFRFVGLVRNPVDTLYSMWKRWRTVPEARAVEWCRAYGNLLWLSDEAPDLTRVVRYEDLVADPAEMRDLLDFLGLQPESAVGYEFHRGSLGAWRNDPHFGYQPDLQLRALALEFGYSPDEVENRPSGWWPVEREVWSRGRRVRTRAGSIWRGLARR